MRSGTQTDALQGACTRVALLCLSHAPAQSYCVSTPGTRTTHLEIPPLNLRLGPIILFFSFSFDISPSCFPGTLRNHVSFWITFPGIPSIPIPGVFSFWGNLKSELGMSPTFAKNWSVGVLPPPLSRFGKSGDQWIPHNHNITLSLLASYIICFSGGVQTI